MRKTLLALVALVAATGVALGAQDRRNEQFYYPGSFNWSFLSAYPEAARLFNAFDYGHAVLYERLYTRLDSAGAAAALEKEYRYLTMDLLVRPPRFAVAEEVVEPAYAKLAWRAKLMFDWAHVLHRQIYDVYADERKAGVQAAVARFWQMLRDPPGSMPHVMPMTATVAPEFTRRHPRAAAIFDNLHMMHDIISDVLAADTVPREKKREVIYTALAEFRDTTRNVMTHDDWLMMGHHMGGIEAMGGPATGLLATSASAAPTAAMPTMPGMDMGHGEGGARMSDQEAVRRVVEAVATLSQAKDVAGLDTLFAP